MGDPLMEKEGLVHAMSLRDFCFVCQNSIYRSFLPKNQAHCYSCCYCLFLKPHAESTSNLSEPLPFPRLPSNASHLKGLPWRKLASSNSPPRFEIAFTNSSSSSIRQSTRALILEVQKMALTIEIPTALCA